MTHLMHDCKSEFAEEIIASLRENHAWPHDKIPLNVDVSRRTGTSRHEKCPYCGIPKEEMEQVPVEDAMRLGVNLKASGSMSRPANQYKQENVEIARELAKLREEISAMKKKKGGSD